MVYVLFIERLLAFLFKQVDAAIVLLAGDDGYAEKGAQGSLAQTIVPP